MANRNYASGGKMYAMHTKPVLLDLNFVVDSTNGNGLGIRQLKGPLVQNVFMHTTASPGLGNSNQFTPNIPVRNPNPSGGVIIVQFEDNYNRSLTGFKTIVSPLNGTPSTTVAAGVPVVIVSLGTATPAQWQAVGLPKGITPAIGVSFVPTTSATIGGGAAVEPPNPSGSGIASIETVGDPNTTLSPDPTKYQGFGGQIILQARDYTMSDAAPVDGTVISLSFLLNDSSVILQGE